jgi:hypothetical protein
MWITKVFFKGSDGNSTTTIDESTDKQFAEFKYGREIAKWLKILCSLEFPYIIHDKNGTLRTKLSLEIINDYILLQNNSNNTNLSFEISVYETWSRNCKVVKNSM